MTLHPKFELRCEFCGYRRELTDNDIHRWIDEKESNRRSDDEMAKFFESADGPYCPVIKRYDEIEGYHTYKIITSFDIESSENKNKDLIKKEKPKKKIEEFSLALSPVKKKKENKTVLIISLLSILIVCGLYLGQYLFQNETRQIPYEEPYQDPVYRTEYYDEPVYKTEYYTEQEPYTDTEYYTDQETYIDTEYYTDNSVQPSYTTSDTYFTSVRDSNGFSEGSVSTFYYDSDGNMVRRTDSNSVSDIMNVQIQTGDKVNWCNHGAQKTLEIYNNNQKIYSVLMRGAGLLGILDACTPYDYSFSNTGIYKTYLVGYSGTQTITVIPKTQSSSPEQKSRQVTKTRPVQKSRQVTKYRDIQKSREVIDRYDKKSKQVVDHYEEKTRTKYKSVTHLKIDWILTDLNLQPKPK